MININGRLNSESSDNPCLTGRSLSTGVRPQPGFDGRARGEADGIADFFEGGDFMATQAEAADHNFALFFTQF